MACEECSTEARGRLVIASVMGIALGAVVALMFLGAHGASVSP